MHSAKNLLKKNLNQPAVTLDDMSMSCSRSLRSVDFLLFDRRNKHQPDVAIPFSPARWRNDRLFASGLKLITCSNLFGCSSLGAMNIFFRNQFAAIDAVAQRPR